MRKKSLWLTAVAVVLAGACHRSPIEPTPTPDPTPPLVNVAGNWSGTWEDRDGVTAFVMNLNQSGTTVTGTWELANFDWRGNVSGSVDAKSFSGTFTVNAPRAGGGTCTGTAAFAGPTNLGAQTLRWSSVGITGGCSFSTGSITVNVQRR